MKSRMLKVIGFLLLGAIISVAVAWVCMQLPMHAVQATPVPGLSEADWTAIEQLGYSRVPNDSLDAWTSDWRGFGIQWHEVWYNVKLIQSTPQNPVVVVSPHAYISCGWPLRCFRGERSMRYEVAEAWTSGRPLNYMFDGSRPRATCGSYPTHGLNQRRYKPGSCPLVWPARPTMGRFL